MMRKSLVFALMLLMSVGAALAQTGSSAEVPVTSLTVEGTLVSTGPSSLDIEKTGGTRMAFTLAPNLIVPKDLPLGSSVSVTYSELPAGQFQASRISAVSSSAAAVTPPVSEPETTATAAPADEVAAAPESLPKTASNLPLVALFGITLLAAALWLRFFCQRAPQR